MRRNRLPLAALLLSSASAHAQLAGHRPALPPVPAAQGLVTAPVDDAVTAQLPGSMALALRTATDRGTLAAATPMAHVQLLLKRPDARQAALDALADAQVLPGSPHYRQWLTPATLRDDYGPAPSDVAALTAWLTRHGFVVDAVSPTFTSVDFSGTAGQIAGAFHVTLHHVQVGREMHVANLADPAIPAALAGIVGGMTLSDFFPKPLVKPMGTAKLDTTSGSWQLTRTWPNFKGSYKGKNFLAVDAYDFQAIYNTPAFVFGTSFGTPAGQFQNVAVVERSDILPRDVVSFSSLITDGAYPTNDFVVSHPGKCTKPGRNDDEIEAALDVEWANAPINDGTVVEAACADTSTTSGVQVAFQNLVEDGAGVATIPTGSIDAISVSYGICEQFQSLAGGQAWRTLTEEAATQGISVFVSSGDDLLATCNAADPLIPATLGIGANGLATSPYVTAVGGTDFDDTIQRSTHDYWYPKNILNRGTILSAISYVPEIPWNDSCTSSDLLGYLGVSPADTLAFCNRSKTYLDGLDNIEGSGGGQSLYVAKPSWQSGPGVPSDGVRDIPDVSAFAGNGEWNHALIYCMSDRSVAFGAPCNVLKNGNLQGQIAGGTSFVAPAYAGIAAIIASYKGGLVGNFAPRLYQLARTQFANDPLSTSCRATLGRESSSGCIFHNVTTGDNVTVCFPGTPNCSNNDPNSKLFSGILTTPNNPMPFQSQPGYNLVTGLGSVNILNLLLNY